ncbi:MAG: pentapeptide repeat-containing protein [Nitrososphaera sp.]
MKQKILVVTLIAILLIGAVSTPIDVLATTKNGYDDSKKDNDDKNKNEKDDDHKQDSCQHIPKETPFRNLWVFVCSLQTQIDQINEKLSHINSGGGGTGTGGSNQWCPTARNISLGHATLQLQNLVGCDLSNSYFGDSIMQYANLRGANLTNSDLSGASLNYADLSGAILVGTNFNHADLTGITTAGCHGTPTGTPVAGTLPVCGP